MNVRREHDALGERDVPAEALYGIHTLRAMENFPVLGRPVHPGLCRAFGAVKLAAAGLFLIALPAFVIWLWYRNRTGAWFKKTALFCACFAAMCGWMSV